MADQALALLLCSALPRATTHLLGVCRGGLGLCCHPCRWHVAAQLLLGLLGGLLVQQLICIFHLGDGQDDLGRAVRCALLSSVLVLRGQEMAFRL